jgi:7-carboxy-7-deazaguanine synthase
MTYSVKEMYYTLQGEGAHTGRAAVFLRFSGCNLWSGREEDRPQAVCKFCDTDFIGTNGVNGGKFKSASTLTDRVKELWNGASGKPYVVCTGGEPLLQLDVPLIRSLHSAGFEVAVETNGTLTAPDEIDWICVSPKADAEIVQKTGNELKLVYPQKEPNVHPHKFEHLKFENFFLQPMYVSDAEQRKQNIDETVEFCLENPQWRLSLQTHKFIGID